MNPEQEEQATVRDALIDLIAGLAITYGGVILVMVLL